MSYYIVNAAGQTEGPYPAEWIQANAVPSTLVSHHQQWVPLAQHPDFQQPVSVPRQGEAAEAELARLRAQLEGRGAG